MERELLTGRGNCVLDSGPHPYIVDPASPRQWSGLLSGREPDDFREDAPRSLHVRQPDDLTFTNATELNPLVSPEDLRMGSDRGSNRHVVFGPEWSFNDNKRGVLRQGNRNDSSLHLVGAARPRFCSDPRQTRE